jgi:hypothetical protein
VVLCVVCCVVWCQIVHKGRPVGQLAGRSVGQSVKSADGGYKSREANLIIRHKIKDSDRGGNKQVEVRGEGGYEIEKKEKRREEWRGEERKEA